MRVSVAALTLSVALAACADCGQGISIGCGDDADCPAGFACTEGTCQASSARPDGAVAEDARSDGQVVVTDAAGSDAPLSDVAPVDAAPADSVQPDHAIADVAVADLYTDATAPDLPASDCAAPDTAAVDSALPDSAAPDTAGPDAASEDGALADRTSVDLGAPDTAQPDLATEDGAGWILCPGIPTPQADPDGDHIGSDCDNCPAVDNPGQGDADHDDVGDACDLCAADPLKTAPGLCGCGFVDSSADTDVDTVLDCVDNCPADYNLLQDDDDSDGDGDACDLCTDVDGDGYGDPGYMASTCVLDNCPADPNAGQEDGDWDGHGDVCDAHPASAALQFATYNGPVTGCGNTSLVSDGDDLWLLCKWARRLFSSPSGLAATWVEKAAPSTMGSVNDNAGMGDAAMAYDPAGDRLISSRWRDADIVASNDWEKDRVGIYYIPSNTWTLIRTSPPAESTHGHVVVGTKLYAIHGAGGLPLKRFELTSVTPTQYIEESSDFPWLGPDADGEDSSDWLGGAAKMTVLGGSVYVIKNDWITDVSTNPAGDGDKLMRFAPADYAANGATTLTRLASLPFEVGRGSALVALPAGWAGLGAQGGLLVIAGTSPSDQDGNGPNSDLYAIFDVAAATFWPTAHLPSVLGAGTSAAFHQGKVIIKVGDNYLFWVLRPVPD